MRYILIVLFCSSCGLLSSLENNISAGQVINSTSTLASTSMHNSEVEAKQKHDEELKRQEQAKLKLELEARQKREETNAKLREAELQARTKEIELQKEHIELRRKQEEVELEKARAAAEERRKQEALEQQELALKEEREAKERHEQYLLMCGPIPKQVEFTILKYIKKYANDPKSISLAECSFPKLTDDSCWRVYCRYRGKNAYGALVVKVEAFYFIENKVTKQPLKDQTDE
jgi:DNA polymerase III alpha subunit (gram-positive type)